jgi:hypothetical protein
MLLPQPTLQNHQHSVVYDMCTWENIVEKADLQEEDSSALQHYATMNDKQLLRFCRITVLSSSGSSTLLDFMTP